MNSRTLCIATLVGCFGFSFSGAGAAELADVDLSNIPLNKPTLDYLHENNVQIPQTEYDDEGNLVESGSILAPESAYALTEVPAGADGAAPVGDNIITKFNYNSETGEFTPVYYQVSLKQTEFGDPQGDVTLTFGWQKTENEYGDEYNEFVQDPANPIGQTITYKYNSSETTAPDGGSYSAEYINQVQPVTLENPDSTSSSDYQHIGGVSGVTNFENVLFKDNNTNVDITIAEDGPYTHVDILGGALNNSGNIDTLSGDFINNSISSTINYGNVSSYGGALYNSGNITNLNATFSNNTIKASNYISFGGALYNAGSIENITGDFIGNSVGGSGGAIFNRGTIGNITGDFIGNYATDGDGGAIFNRGTIGNITGDFIGNYATDGDGGAIYNYDNSTIGNITGDFIGNSASSSGGAIFNGGSSTIGDIAGDFIGNYTGGDGGGAIYNRGTIGNITGDFIGNSGGAIYNVGTIGNITGDFIGNSGGAIYNAGTINGDISGNFTDNSGGAIHNTGTINGDISGNFLNNIGSTGYYDSSAAIYNTGTITGNITGTFTNNTGYAIFNGGILNNISGDFNKNEIGVYINYASETNSISGNFIENEIAIETDWSAKINNITGHFENNGTAIDYGAEYGTDTISGDFINNSNSAIIYTTEFGTGNIENIKGNFIGNHSTNSGGALYTGYGAYIKNLISDFKDNYVSSTSNSVSGGAIANIPAEFNQGINTITGTFQNNYAYTSNGNAYGGAIYNSDILGGYNPSDNRTVISEDSTADSFVLYMDVSNFKNTSTGEIKTLYSYDGDVDVIKENLANGYKIIFKTLNEGSLDIDAENWDALLESLQQDIDSGVYTELHPYEKFNLSEEDLAIGQGIIGSTFIGNYAQSDNGNAAGGAIYNSGTIGLKNNGEFTGGIINSSFYNNYAKSENGTAQGGAIYTTQSLNIIANDNGSSIFSGNYTETNGVKKPNAIYVNTSAATRPETQVVSINTQNVTTEQKYNILAPTLSLNANSNGIIQFDDTIDGNILSTNIITTTSDLVVDDYYKDRYNISTVDELVDYLKENLPYGFYEYMTDEKFLETAYYLGYLEHTNEQSVTTTETTAYSLQITGDETGKVILNNDVTAHEYDDEGNVTAQAPVNISLENTNLYLGARDDIFDGNNLDLKSGFMSMVNDFAGISALNNLTVSGDVNFAADVDLANKEMDRFTAAEYGEHTGNINVVGMNLLSDAVEGESVTAVYFAEPDLKNNVVNGTGELPDSFQTTAYTPIYKYNVIYDKDNQYDGKGDGGYFVFAKGDIILPDEPDEPDEPNLPIPPTGGGTTGNPSDAFNPAVLATPVGNLAAGQAAMNEAFKYVFEHADAFTQLPAMERYAKINANKYALSTDFNENMPSYADQLQNKAVWFRPYTTFETMNIKNGPKVDAITYGSLVGFDGDFKEMKNGWSRIFTGYAGYMGSSLNYSGVDTTMNGGLLGFTETFYKGNFWTAITASAGASVGESHTMYGKEDYTSLLAGVGSKTGYNFEFKDGKFIIQPIMFLSYTFVNTFDYKNAAGVSIESDPLHTIQLNPSVRFIANLKGGWQPYASVGMVWNLMNESKVTANNVKLPEMSVKPYVEYGVGVQRNWADKFTAFLQAMIRNGGRNGVALTGGFRFMLGSDSKNSDKPKVKKEIKSL